MMRIRREDFRKSERKKSVAEYLKKSRSNLLSRIEIKMKEKEEKKQEQEKNKEIDVKQPEVDKKREDGD